MPFLVVHLVPNIRTTTTRSRRTARAPENSALAFLVDVPMPRHRLQITSAVLMLAATSPLASLDGNTSLTPTRKTTKRTTTSSLAMSTRLQQRPRVYTISATLAIPTPRARTLLAPAMTLPLRANTTAAAHPMERNTMGLKTRPTTPRYVARSSGSV
jgi:hypothetical protein